MAEGRLGGTVEGKGTEGSEEGGRTKAEWDFTRADRPNVVFVGTRCAIAGWSDVTMVSVCVISASQWVGYVGCRIVRAFGLGMRSQIGRQFSRPDGDRATHSGVWGRNGIQL